MDAGELRGLGGVETFCGGGCDVPTRWQQLVRGDFRHQCCIFGGVDGT